PADSTPEPGPGPLWPGQGGTLAAQPGGDLLDRRRCTHAEASDAPAIVGGVAERLSNPARGLEARPLNLRPEPRAGVAVGIREAADRVAEARLQEDPAAAHLGRGLVTGQHVELRVAVGVRPHLQARRLELANPLPGHHGAGGA